MPQNQMLRSKKTAQTEKKTILLESASRTFSQSAISIENLYNERSSARCATVRELGFFFDPASIVYVVLGSALCIGTQRP